MYYASFISLYWPYLQLLPFFAGSGGCSKLVLASIKALDCSMFQQHKTFLTRHISLVKAFKWNPVLTRFIITKQRDFDKKSRWYIEKRSSHFSHLKSTHCETALRVWRRRTKRCFPSLLPQAWCAWCELTSRSWCTPTSIWSLNCLHFLCYPGVHNYVYTCACVHMCMCQQKVFTCKSNYFSTVVCMMWTRASVHRLLFEVFEVDLLLNHGVDAVPPTWHHPPPSNPPPSQASLRSQI